MNKQDLTMSVFAAICMIIVIVYNSFFIVNEGQQALITQFGEYKYTCKDSGLFFKWPWMQQVELYEKRVLSLEIPASELTLKDQKRLVVDLFIRYEIVDPIEFYKRLRHEQAARNRLSYAAVSALRNVLGSYTLSEVLNIKRHETMLRIKDNLASVAEQLGLKIIDVRISKTDLPNENRDAVYKKMISSLRKEAQIWRGKGKEEELKRKASALNESELILAHADQESKRMMGEADAESLDIVNKAYIQNEDFAKYYIAYNSWLNGLNANTTAFMSADELEYMLGSNEHSSIKTDKLLKRS